MAHPLALNSAWRSAHREQTRSAFQDNPILELAGEISFSWGSLFQQSINTKELDKEFLRFADVPFVTLCAGRTRDTPMVRPFIP
ncbi:MULTISPECIES: hypothetical protein [unclassified Variovorax]|uniref:hypothetical protein n=1 Tax=unclassified Variovorax TaxID=663243 RepID=UPI003F4839D7